MSKSKPKQPRERPVPCSRCAKDTWNINAVCDRCTEKKENK